MSQTYNICLTHSEDTFIGCVVPDNKTETAACQCVWLQWTVPRTVPKGISQIFLIHFNSKSQFSGENALLVLLYIDFFNWAEG